MGKPKNVISVNLLEKYIEEKCGEHDTFAISNLIDIFIDKGIFVPSVVHTERNDILRAYKIGEVAKLTILEMELFVHMLGIYMERTGKDVLDKTEFEKLCVLF